MPKKWMSWVAGAVALGGGFLLFAAWGDRESEPDPTIVMTQRDLLVRRLKMGDVRLEQGDLAGALDAHRESLAIAKRGAARDPANPTWQHDMAVIHFRLSYALKETGAMEEARAHARTCVTIYRKLAEKDTQRRGELADLEAYLEKLDEEGEQAGAGG